MSPQTFQVKNIPSPWLANDSNFLKSTRPKCCRTDAAICIGLIVSEFLLADSLTRLLFDHWLDSCLRVVNVPVHDFHDPPR